MSDVATPIRIVPGAPPPTPLSKSQKKKRRAAQTSGKDDQALDSPAVANGHGHADLNSATDAALIDSLPTPSHIKSELATKPEDLANAAIASEAAAGVAPIISLPTKRASAVVELVNKRYRTLHKKIQRIKEYSAKPVDTLNEDQRKSLATLPVLEASAKEVEEVRKAIEVHEAEEAVEEVKRQKEIEAIVRKRIADAVAEARATAVSRTVQLVTIIPHLAQLPKVASSEEDQNLISEITTTIHQGEPSQIQSTVELYLAGQGNYGRLTELLEVLHNPAPATPPVAEPEPEPQVTPAVTESAVKGLPPGATMTGSYHFMQESELEPTTPFEEGAEWVEHPGAPETLHTAPDAEPTEETVAKVEGNIDWAADDHEDTLPPISGLQEHFGASGQATPIAEAPSADFPDASASGWETAGAEATKETKEDESDGFTTIASKRPGYGSDWRGGDRGRGRGRGGYRGRGTGEWKPREPREGGEGRGGYHSGGESRPRGEYRGGRPRGEWRGRGEHRGGGDYRGRGEGRGGYRGRPQTEAQ